MQRRNTSRDRNLATKQVVGWWIIANAIAGFIIGFLEGGRFQFLATLVLTGLVVGIFQWLVLRWRFQFSWVWIPLTFVGWLLGMQVTIALSPLIDPFINWLSSQIGGGVFWLQTLQQPIVTSILGIFQGVLLRRSQSLAPWILWSALGGIGHGMVGTSVCAIACPLLSQWGGAAVATAVTYGAAWFAYGMITGFGIFRWFGPLSLR